jgi:hypothetical protein
MAPFTIIDGAYHNEGSKPGLCLTYQAPRPKRKVVVEAVKLVVTMAKLHNFVGRRTLPALSST